MAAKNGHYLIVKFLVEQKANTTLQNTDGKTALNLCNESIKQHKLKKGEKPVKNSLLDKLLATRGVLDKKVDKNIADGGRI